MAALYRAAIAPFFTPRRASGQASGILTTYAAASSPAISLKIYDGLGRSAYAERYRRAPRRSATAYENAPSPSETQARQEAAVPAFAAVSVLSLIRWFKQFRARRQLQRITDARRQSFACEQYRRRRAAALKARTV